MKRLLPIFLILFASLLRADSPATQPASKPALKDGLSVTVVFAKPEFTTKEQPKFVVQFKNTSKDTLSLFDADWFWNWTTTFTRLDGPTAGPWQLQLAAKVKRAAFQTHRLAPGETLEVPIDLDHALPFNFTWQGEQDRLIAPITHLAPGKYQLTITIDLKENTTVDGNGLAKHWVNQLTTEPVTFEITDTPKDQ